MAYCPDCSTEHENEASVCSECGESLSTQSTESGSTIIGIIGLLIALFFFYMAVTRMWWWFSFDASDYLILGLTYVVLGLIFAGVAGYGLSSRQRGVSIMGTGSLVISTTLWIAALYYWIQGQFLGGTADDIFNALGLGLGGAITLIIGFGSLYIGQKRGIIEPESGEEAEINISEASTEIRESWHEGSERGDRAVKGFYERIILGGPIWIWSVGVLFGSLLSFSVWISAGVESDAALGIGLIGGMLVLFLTVLLDIERTNRLHENLNFRWYAYVVPAVIPLIGWMFGLLWLARKRQKTGSALS